MPPWIVTRQPEFVLPFLLSSPFFFYPSCSAQASLGTLSEKRVAADKGASDFLPRRSLKQRRVSALKLSLSSRLSLLRTPSSSNGPPFFFINIQSISPISKRGIHPLPNVMTIRDPVTSACARETNTPSQQDYSKLKGSQKLSASTLCARLNGLDALRGALVAADYKIPALNANERPPQRVR